MLEKDLLLSASHDLVIENFDLQLTSNEQIVAQRVKQALLLFKGEWFLDIDLGVPYYSDILGQKNSIDAVRSIFINEIRSVEGVKDLTEFNIDFDEANRKIAIDFTIIDDLNNQINVTL